MWIKNLQAKKVKVQNVQNSPNQSMWIENLQAKKVKVEMSKIVPTNQCE